MDQPRLIDIARIALIGFVIHATTVTATFDPDQLCSLIVNGTKIKDPRACNTWIQCVDGEPITGVCTDNQFYDRATGECVAASSIKCISSNPCATSLTSTGFVPDPYSCNSYYYCSNNSGTAGICQSGLNFDPDTSTCNRNYACVEKMDPDDYCNIVPDGVFIKVPDSCTDYEVCWKETLINNTCPDAFYFNAAKGICDYQHNVDCETTTDLPLNVECTKAGVFISDESSCNGYYYCKANEDGSFTYMHGVCPMPEYAFFDPIDGGVCVPRTRITCKYDRCVGMGNDYIQLANESNDGCHGFSICQYGKTIGSGSCPDGQYFDELTQFCTTDVVNYTACALSNTDSTTVAATETTDPVTSPTTTANPSDALSLINVAEVQD